MNLGDKIIKLRKDNKMSQDDLAEILNVTRQTISNWENSKNYPDIETLILISEKFNISLDFLLKGDYKMIKDINKKIKNNKKLIITTIILTITLLLLTIGTKFYNEYYYKFHGNNIDYGSFTVANCKYNNESIKLYVQVPMKEKKWYEDKVYDSSTSKPKSYFIIDTKTNEKREDIKNEMNINMNNFDNCLELLEYMKQYIIDNGGTCN